MDPNGILMITLTILGALSTVGIWGILFALVKSRSGANAERSAALRGISEECAEADKMISSSATLAMNARAFRSSLTPKAEKIQKLLTANMHLLDVYFVKYTETRLAAYQSAVASSEINAAFPIDKFLADAKPLAAPAEPLSPTVEQDLKARAEAPQGEKAEHPSHDTVLVKGKEKEEPIELPAIDLRTGIITVAEAEEAFDFEKEISAKVNQLPSGPKPDEPKAVPMEKTMRWDKSELSGFAGRPEAIVVEGADSGAKKPVAQEAAPPPEQKGEEAMISGEDIENTLDSFFGLGDR